MALSSANPSIGIDIDGKQEGKVVVEVEAWRGGSGHGTTKEEDDSVEVAKKHQLNGSFAKLLNYPFTNETYKRREQNGHLHIS